MTDIPALLRELQSTWRRDIPLAAGMAIAIESYRDGALRVHAPLDPNRNVHGTAFAGSLFSVCVLTGWGSVWLALRQAGLDGHIVVSESRIQYRKAVVQEIVCACRPDAAALARGLEELRTAERMSLPLVCAIEADGKRAVTFEGTYIVRGK